ncbi:MAG: hypothetical protein AAF849_17225 [Bacteroidota bacterium]
MKRILIFLYLFSSSHWALPAQITELNEKGVLIVRLESGEAKLKTIQNLIEKGGTSKQYWEQQLETVQLALEHKNRAIVAAFEQNYRFSEVFYMYDVDSKKLTEGATEAIFLNKDLAKDNNIQLNDRPFIIAAEAETESGAEGIYLLRPNLERLEKPLPHFVKLNNLFFLFNQFSSQKAAIEKRYQQAAKRLNNKLRNYLLKRGRVEEVD